MIATILKLISYETNKIAHLKFVILKLFLHFLLPSNLVCKGVPSDLKTKMQKIL